MRSLPIAFLGDLLDIGPLQNGICLQIPVSLPYKNAYRVKLLKGSGLMELRSKEVWDSLDFPQMPSNGDIWNTDGSKNENWQERQSTEAGKITA